MAPLLKQLAAGCMSEEDAVAAARGVLHASTAVRHAALASLFEVPLLGRPQAQPRDAEMVSCERGAGQDALRCTRRGGGGVSCSCASQAGRPAGNAAPAGHGRSHGPCDEGGYASRNTILHGVPAAICMRAPLRPVLAAPRSFRRFACCKWRATT